MKEKELILKLSKFGEFLSTRFLGKLVREKMEKVWNGYEIIYIDASGVEGMTNSFADECFGKLLQEKGISQFKEKLRFQNLNKFSEKVLIKALSNRLPTID